VSQSRIGVVVVNHNGGGLTLECLHSVLRTEWPADALRVVLVDNASRDQAAPDGVVARVRRDLPVVHVVESPINTGFAGGVNLGIRSLFATSPHVDRVALVNNDAVVDAGWLAPLAAALADDDRLGAACPKILFAGQFAELRFAAPTVQRGRGDDRELGVRVSGARVDGTDVWSRTQLVAGFWGRELDEGDPVAGEWSKAEATLRLPVDPSADPLPHAELRLRAPAPTTIGITSGALTSTIDVTTDDRWHPVALGGRAIDVINNVGTELLPDGYGVDRGYLEPDDGRNDEPADVFAWCGAAVLLRREYLDDVGLLDERLFLYYEDLELSWRGAERGWRYRYVPTSVVRHVHAASSGEGSALKDYYDERNRLLVLTRHAGGPAGARAAGRHLLITASYARRDIVSPLLRGERPSTQVVARRLRALGAYARRAPGMLRGDESGSTPSR
jgi:GT2 family glycosyltransferase